jgi:hypothetical protein
MAKPGDITSYLDMCKEEGASLQRGMNFRLGRRHTVILMSRRRGAPYEDRLVEGGRVLIYEGHDAPRTAANPDPKKIDQPFLLGRERPTQNALFVDAADAFKAGKRRAEAVRVYEKIQPGIWVYNGTFLLTDAWQEHSSGRGVFRFRLELGEGSENRTESGPGDPSTLRMIPSAVKLAVWKRDRGRCAVCGSTKDLHFDHIIPFSKGGLSSTAENIQVLCAVHNLAKHDRIE